MQSEKPAWLDEPGLTIYSMLRLVVIVIFGLLPYSVVADEVQIQKNPVDLTTTKFFARPVTELEVTLINLKARAQKVASIIADDSRLHLIKDVGFRPQGDAGFDPQSGMLVLLLQFYVTEMEDPWREVCDLTLGSFEGLFHFPSPDLDVSTKLRMLEEYFGEAIRVDQANAKDGADVFLKSIISRVFFSVADRTPTPKLKWLRSCAKDELTGRTSYTEYRYQ